MKQAPADSGHAGAVILAFRRGADASSGAGLLEVRPEPILPARGDEALPGPAPLPPPVAGRRRHSRSSLLLPVAALVISASVHAGMLWLMIRTPAPVLPAGTAGGVIDVVLVGVPGEGSGAPGAQNPAPVSGDSGAAGTPAPEKETGETAPDNGKTAPSADIEPQPAPAPDQPQPAPEPKPALPAAVPPEPATSAPQDTAAGTRQDAAAEHDTPPETPGDVMHDDAPAAPPVADEPAPKVPVAPPEPDDLPETPPAPVPPPTEKPPAPPKPPAPDKAERQAPPPRAASADKPARPDKPQRQKAGPAAGSAAAKPATTPGAAPGTGGRTGAAASVAGNGGTGPTAAGAGGTEDGWRRRLMLHLEKRKRFPPGGTNGTVRVTFTIDRNGNVLSASVSKPAANGALNREAEKLLSRASPVPAPPPEALNGQTLTLTVPLVFER